MRAALRTLLSQLAWFSAAALFPIEGNAVIHPEFGIQSSTRLSQQPSAVSSDRPFLWNGSAGYQATGYLYAPTKERETTFQSLTAQSTIHTQGTRYEIGASGNLLLNVQPDIHPYFEIPDLYAGTLPGVLPVQLRIGRKIEPWSQIDDNWQLGIIQPRFRWDYLHPQQVGLTGLFAELNVPGVRVLGFASPLYIPERGVPVRVDNGQFNSPSAWFIPPSSRITLFDRDTPVRYDLSIPSVSDIVFQISAGVLAKYSTSEGIWASGAYAIKPMNQLLLGHDAHLRMDALEVLVKIAPRVAYHHVTSLEAGYETKRFGFTMSLLHEQPVDQPMASNWTVQDAAPATAMSPCLSIALGETPSLLSLGYLWRWGGNAPDRGRDASAKSVFEARYPFHQALRLSLVSPGFFGLAPHDFTATSGVIYDASEDGAIWSTELKYGIHRQWRLNFGADFLATQVLSGTEEKESSHFIRRYQVHNRLQAGVSYVF